MNKKLLSSSFIAMMAFLVGLTCMAKSEVKIIDKVIYGVDNRMDVFESSDSLMKKISRGTAAQMSNDSLSLKDGIYTLKSETLMEGGVCESEPYSHQLSAANCSGFLVAPDILVTAGHCIYGTEDCETQSWVFDYANIDGLKNDFTFTKDQVFHCTKILAREKNENVTLNDYAILKLDRPVFGRTPLEVRRKGKLADDAVLTVLGHPSGLPLKITPAADMRNNSNSYYFVTNSDTYGGNSGSAVVDSRTGIVEGILVRGDIDYKESADGSCSVSIVHDEKTGRGEDATRITNLIKTYTF